MLAYHQHIPCHKGSACCARSSSCCKSCNSRQIEFPERLQESPEAVWGVLELEAHALAEKIVLDDELDQATAVDILKPVCR